jgi:membrane-bound inhibitor of C-type lysozyme
MARLVSFCALGLAALILGACATMAPEDATDAPMAYVCDGGKRFTASYPLKGYRARVSAGGRTYGLPHVRSGSGVRYAKGGVELLTKGSEAMLDGASGAPYRNCRTG